MRDKEYHRKVTTTPVKKTTFAIALIRLAKPFIEKILPNPLIKLSFSGLKLKLLLLNVRPPPTIDCISTIKMIVGIPKIAATVKIIVKARHEFWVVISNNSLGYPNEKNDPQTSKIPTEKKFNDYFKSLDRIFHKIAECERGYKIDKFLESPICHTTFQRLN